MTRIYFILLLFGLTVVGMTHSCLADKSVHSPALSQKVQEIVKICGAPEKTLTTDTQAIETLEEISGTSGAACACQAAQMQLAIMHDSGEGVKKDPAIAYAYAFKAYDGFMPDDITAKKILTASLSSEQVQKVKTILNEYRKKFSGSSAKVDDSEIDIKPKIMQKYLTPVIRRCHALPTLREKLQFSLKICGVSDSLFKTDEEAIEALKLSAETQAKPDLCFWGLMDLAQMYEAGEGVEKNAAIAYAYAYRANLGFMPPAVTSSEWRSAQERNDIAARRILTTPLTPEQTQQVKTILRDYRQKFSRTPIDIDTIDITPQKR